MDALGLALLILSLWPPHLCSVWKMEVQEAMIPTALMQVPADAEGGTPPGR